MGEPAPYLDELDHRIRSLEAERLRPVPPLFTAGGSSMKDDLAAIERRRQVLEELEIDEKED